ncbi:NAD(+) diphosphatase [Arenimonas donghaensis]|uniref:NAD(+) diphosphatase n=1 Tax=Arenimonas donghaensis TaxID=375061 RepID=UPI000554B1E5|nr:NAD(+) diphosphatase [Arenimonas donghaensis]
MSAVPSGFAFRGPGLDRAELLREDAAGLDARWPTARVLVVDAEGLARFRRPSKETAPATGAEASPEDVICSGSRLADTRPATASLLGVDGETAWFVLPHESLQDPLPGRLGLREAAATWPALPASALAQARALVHWQQRNRHCGACGAAVVFGRAGYSANCPGCGLDHYPRTDPAVIVAVTDGSRLLLGRQASWPAGRWSVLAGFVEPGESLEQAIAREVMEEAAVPVLSTRYSASQPWPFPGSLMVGFHAIGEPVVPRVSDELEQARWFTRADIEREVAAGELKLSPRLSIARTLIEEWLAQQG